MKYSYSIPSIPVWKIPSGRGGCSIVSAENKIVVFGGHYLASKDLFEYLNETWVYDIDNEEWHKMTCKGEIPTPRYGHCASIFGSKMFIIGGRGPKGGLLHDVHILDLVEWTWTTANCSSKGPSGRLFAACEQVGRKIVLHGGWDGNRAFDDLYIFDTESFSWTVPKTTGFAPPPRYGHTLTLTPEGKLIAFGGCNVLNDSSVPKYGNDLRELDTNTMTWTFLKVGGDVPTARCGHTATLLNNGRQIIYYGGWGKGGCQSADMSHDPRASTVHVLDIGSLSWYRPECIDKHPPRHIYYHAACTIDTGLVLFGGFDGRQACNSVLLFQFEEPAEDSDI